MACYTRPTYSSTPIRLALSLRTSARTASCGTRLFDETVRTVSAVGRVPSGSFVATAKAQLTQPGSTQTSSMYRDLQKNNPVEVDQIIGDLITRALKAGIDTPLHDAAFAQLSAYQNGLSVHT
jgi:ketopantoate reductase